MSIVEFFRGLSEFMRMDSESRHNLLDHGYQRQIQGPGHVGVLERPKTRKRRYLIKQTHNIEFTVEVEDNEQLREWDQCVVIALEDEQGNVLPINHPGIVEFKAFRTQPSEFVRLDGVERDTSHPPVVRAPQQSQKKPVLKTVEEVEYDDYPEPAAGVIGACVHVNEIDYIYCNDCKKRINYEKIDARQGFVWDITEDQTNDGAYTCNGCKKSFL